MSNSKSVVSSSEIYDAGQLDRAEYQALETALLQTARGRNFLSEYLRRNGADAIDARTCMVEEGLIQQPSATIANPDTDKILQAVEKLHNAVMTQQGNAPSEHMRMDILEMAKAIAKTRSEISAMRTDGDNDHLSVASEEMDAIVQSTEKATNDILQAAEKIQETAWHLREAGAEEASCEEIDNNATDIYMACSFQDLTGQRTTKVVRVLQYLEARITSMIEIWGISEEGGEGPQEDTPATPALEAMDERPDAHLLNGPQANAVALGQDNIDALLGDEPFDSVAEEVSPVVEEDKASEPMSEGAMDELFDIAASAEPIDEEQLKALFS